MKSKADERGPLFSWRLFQFWDTRLPGSPEADGARELGSKEVEAGQGEGEVKEADRPMVASRIPFFLFSFLSEVVSASCLLLLVVWGIGRD